MKLRIVIYPIVSLAFIAAVTLKPLSAVQKGDPCLGKGITIRNLTTRDLWYTRNGGACEFWHRNHVFVIKPGDKIEIFSDMTCETKYCNDYTYIDYRSFDKDRDCRVRILPRCTLSDM